MSTPVKLLTTTVGPIYLAEAEEAERVLAAVTRVLDKDVKFEDLLDVADK